MELSTVHVHRHLSLVRLMKHSRRIPARFDEPNFGIKVNIQRSCAEGPRLGPARKSGIIVIVSPYDPTPTFYWPIRAVADLVTKTLQAYRFWRVSPFEFFIRLAAVIVTVSIFSTIEKWHLRFFVNIAALLTPEATCSDAFG